MTPSIHPLESRRLFAVSTVAGVADLVVRLGTSPTPQAVSPAFTTDSFNTLSGTVVDLPVAYGVGAGMTSSHLYLRLFDATPVTKANFLQYLTSGAYNNVFFHRSLSDFILQTGGYTFDNGPRAIASLGTVANESSLSPRDASGRVNTRGTVAMVKVPAALDGNGMLIAGTGPDSATSQFFFNLTDNSGLLDTQNGGTTTFGEVLGGSLATLDRLAGLPTVDVDGPTASTFNDLPVAKANPVYPDDLITLVNPVVVAHPETVFTYTVSTSDPEVVTAAVDAAGLLTLTYGSKVATATVSLTATDLTGASATDTFYVTVANPVLAITYNATTLTSPSNVPLPLRTAFTARPELRTLTLTNTGTGPISLGTPTLPVGLTLAQSLPASLAAGQSTPLVLNVDTSVEATVSGLLEIPTDAVNAVNGKISVRLLLQVSQGLTLGQGSSGGAKSLTYSDADGTKSTLTLKGPGTARIYVTGANAAPIAKGSNLTLSGTNLTLDAISLTDTTTATSFTLSARGGNKTVTLATLAASSPLRSLSLAPTILTDEISLQGLSRSLTLGNVDTALIRIGTPETPITLPTARLGTLTASTVSFTGTVATLSLTSASQSLISATAFSKSVAIKSNFSNGLLVATNSLGKVSAGSWTGSSLRAGVLSSATPNAATDFLSGSRVGSFQVTSKLPGAFAESSIYARTLGTLSLGRLSPGPGAPSSIVTTSITKLAGKTAANKTFSGKQINSTASANAFLIKYVILPATLSLTPV